MERCWWNDENDGCNINFVDLLVDFDDEVLMI